MKRVRDHYFNKAKREGFAARAAYKLQEIDRKRRLLKSGQRVLDLGCAPGSWLQYAAQRLGPKGRLVGIDLQPVTVRLPAAVTVVQGDFTEVEASELLVEGEPFDVILSDMAPKTTGVPSADAARSAGLVETILERCEDLLQPGGTLLAKVFQGAALPALRAQLRERFEEVSLEKPKASRSESVEIFLLGRGYRPAARNAAGGAPDQDGSAAAPSDSSNPPTPVAP